MIGRPRTVSDDAILDAAARVIDRHGPARLTLAQVAAEVGLAPATLLQRFGSKRGLILAVASRGRDALAPIFAAARERHDSPLAALHAALAEMVSGIDSPETLANHLAFLQLDLVDPDLKANAVRHSRELRGHLRRLLEAAMAAGELVPCDSARLAQAVYTTYSGSLTTWAIDGHGTLAEWLRDDLNILLAPVRRQHALRRPASPNP
jgi:AcrR family transcriptional regulator